MRYDAGLDSTSGAEWSSAGVGTAGIAAAVVESSSDAIVGQDLAGTIVSWNPAAERMYGYPASEVVGRSVAMLVPPDRAEETRDLLAAVASGRSLRDVESVRLAKSGREVPVRLGLTPVRDATGAVVGAVAVARDISEQRGAERTISTQSEILAKLFETAPDGILFVDPQGRCAAVNPAAERMFGYGSGELAGTPLEDLVPERDRADHARRRAEYARRPWVRASSAHLQIRGRRRDGTDFPADIALAPLEGLEGPMTIAMVRDMTERERLEAARLEAEARYHVLVEELPAVIYTNSADFETCLYVSPQFQRMLGHNPDRWLEDASYFDELIHPEDLPRVIAAEREAVATGGRFAAEYRMTASDGREVWVRDQATLVRGSDGEPLCWEGVMLDITDRKRVETDLERMVTEVRALSEERRRLLAQLIAAEETERARLAVDIHDDTIQQVSALMMRLDMLGSHHPTVAADENFRRAAEVAQTAIRSLRYLTFELRPYLLDREGIGPAMAAHLHELERMAPVPRYVLHNLLTEEPPIETRVVLYRVAHEALTNARRHARASRVDVTLEWREGHCCLEVRDDGIGFRAGSGESPTGHMGLSTMQDRVKVAGGWYRLESAPGDGTRVAVGIPPIGETADRGPDVGAGR